jgi:hypothetical protein
MADYMFTPDNAQVDPPRFKFNRIHDLESIWWIAVWILFYHVPQIERGDLDAQDAQASQASELFPVGSSIHRYSFLCQSRNIVKRFKVLPPAFQLCLNAILDARDIITNAYKIAEQGNVINEAAFDNVHKQLARIWRTEAGRVNHISYSYIWPSHNRKVKEPVLPPPGDPVLPLPGSSTGTVGRWIGNTLKRVHGYGLSKADLDNKNSQLTND